MKYRFYCEDCQEMQIYESLLVKEECSVNSSHQIREGSLSILPALGTKDYKKLRTELAAYVQANMANLNEADLRVASEHFVVPQEIRDTFYTLEEQMAFGRVFHEKSTEARNKRLQEAIIECFNRLPLQQTFEMVQAMSSGQLIRNYVDYGIEGTGEGDPCGLYDYLQSTSDFSSSGLLNSGYAPVGMTIQQLSDRLMDILKNGNY